MDSLQYFLYLKEGNRIKNRITFTLMITHTIVCVLSFTLNFRETNWLFSSSAGSTQLAESAGYERLVIVTLHRGHTYESLDKIKEEISSKAMELSQDTLPDRMKVRRL